MTMFADDRNHRDFGQIESDAIIDDAHLGHEAEAMDYDTMMRQVFGDEAIQEETGLDYDCDDDYDEYATWQDYDSSCE